MKKNDSNLNIIKVISQKELLRFIKFPMELYNKNEYYVPNIIKSELENFDKNINPAFEFSEIDCFLAVKNKKVVGRIALIINNQDEILLKDKKLRIGWFDFINDFNVCKELIDLAINYSKQKNITKIEGPVGFTNLDKAGMLTKGFDQTATLIGLYNHEYYPEFLEKLGFKTKNHWIEYKVTFPKELPEKITKFSRIISAKYSLKVINFLDKKKSDLLDYSDKILELLEESYKELTSFTPFTEKQKIYYKEKYFAMLSKDLIVCIENEKKELIAFSVVMYDYSSALQKAKGKLFPFGWYHLLKASKNNNSVHFYLIGVKPEYKSKGVPSLIFMELYKIFLSKGISKMETNPQLIENKSIQLLFRDYDPIIHKERKTFVLNINN